MEVSVELTKRVAVFGGGGFRLAQGYSPDSIHFFLISWACRKWPPRAMRFGPAYYFGFGGRADLDVSKLVPWARWIPPRKFIDEVATPIT